MFVIKYDKGSMVTLVQAIQGQPAIYDTKSHYTKEEQDRAWDKISQDVGEKDSLCRDRWHSIKSCYIRHLKYAALNSKRKPYYLAEYLDFLMPFVADRLTQYLTMKSSELNRLPSYLKEALPPSVTSMNNFFVQPVGQTNIQVIKSEPIDVEEVDEEWLKNIQRPSSSKSTTKRSNSETFSTSSKKTKADSSPCQNEDVSFFKSLLPDIARMSSHQKLKFKQEALSIVEDILYATDDFSTVEQTTD